MGQPELYFRQLLSGRDFAVADPLARQMVNFAYAIGDRSTGEALLVDPAYAVGELLDALAPTTCAAWASWPPTTPGPRRRRDGRLVDRGIEALLELAAVPVHLQRDEVPWWSAPRGDSSHFIAHHSGDIVTVEASRSSWSTPRGTRRAASASSSRVISFRATPCFSTVAAARTCPAVTGRHVRIPDHPPRPHPRRRHPLPGHRYSPSLPRRWGDERNNFVLAPRSAAEWLAMFGR